MLKASAAALLSLYLAGCNPFESEIDKCTNALVKSAEPYKDSQQKAGVEADARLMCLRSMSGQK